MANPKYVRLADHMVHGLVVDPETQWSISGYDVKPWPDDKEAARFVKKKINQGVLEGAAQAEFDEAHPEGEGDPSEHVDEAAAFVNAVREVQGRVTEPEHLVQKRIAEHASRIKQARSDNTDEDGTGSDAERRQALISQAEDEGAYDDDPNAQKESTATRARGAAKKATGAAKKRSRSSSDDGGSGE